MSDVGEMIQALRPVAAELGHESSTAGFWIGIIYVVGLGSWE